MVTMMEHNCRFLVQIIDSKGNYHSYNSNAVTLSAAIAEGRKAFREDRIRIRKKSTGNEAVVVFDTHKGRYVEETDEI